MRILLVILISTAFRFAPGGDDSTMTVPGGWRSYTSRPVWFVTAPGLEVQTVGGLQPDSLYEGLQIMPGFERIGEWRAERNGCVRFLTVGQRIVCVRRVPSR